MYQFLLIIVFGLLSIAINAKTQLPINPNISQSSVLDNPTSNLKDKVFAPKGGRVVGSVMEKISLKINKIVFSGNNQYTNTELLAITKKIAKTGKLADAYNIAQAITKKYRKNGFILSRALVPEQSIENGILKIQIIEGFINQIEITGFKSLEKLIDKTKIKNSKPLEAKILERALLLLRDVPGVEIESILRPSQAENASDLIINIKNKPINGSVKFDNHGTKFMGPVRTTVDLNLNSPFDNGSHFSLSTMLMADKTDYSNRELKSYHINSDFPINNNGTRINLSHSNSLVKPGHTMSDLEVESNNNSWMLSISHPIIRQRVQSLKVETGVNYKNLYTDLLQQEFTKDRVRAFFVGFTYDYADNFNGTNLISFRVDRGLNSENATQRGSLLSTKPEANPIYTKLSGRLVREQSFSRWCESESCNKFSLFLSTNWQFSDEPLFSSEEFSVGGRVFGKGYDLGEIAGDKGIAANIELHFKDKKDLLNYDAYSFLDFGTIRNVDQSEQGSENEKQTIRSFGVGVNSNYKNWDFSLEIAKPLASAPAIQTNKDPRTFAQIGYKF